MRSLAQGLQAGLANVGGAKLDVVGFDACLMAMAEVSASIAPYARALLASELLEPGHGWDYQSLGSMVKAYGTGAADTSAGMAKFIIDGFQGQAKLYRTKGITLALVDLQAWGGVYEAITSAAGQLAAQMDTSTNGGEHLTGTILVDDTDGIRAGTFGRVIWLDEEACVTPQMGREGWRVLLVGSRASI